ncbi:hypothetical protein E2C01_013980 [Portunus trituberculatus]|uniref:Uncharacterized protein n=1 Tax=Portunus trituberculatus TaxID=210409 RepID=A0A5B7DIJ0_PORTR|nr:hypothetical protein [Portunus trituberculatus]
MDCSTIKTLPSFQCLGIPTQIPRHSHTSPAASLEAQQPADFLLPTLAGGLENNPPPPSPTAQSARGV